MALRDLWSSGAVRGRASVVACAALLTAMLGVAVAAGPAATERVSVDSVGGQITDGASGYLAISGDGRYVAFSSFASTVVPGDTNGADDIFLHDRRAGVTERVSVDGAGGQANKYSFWPDVSADGRYVAFGSFASNLVPGDTNNANDVFVHNRRTGTTERVSVDGAGRQANEPSDVPAISADGRYVAFISAATNLVTGDTNNQSDVFVHDRRTGTTERVSVDSAGGQANGASTLPEISGDGRYVAFASSASNLVPGDTNGTFDIYVHDRRTGATERVSVDSAGGQANQYSFWPDISGDGRYVAFSSAATNLVTGDSNNQIDVFLHDRRTGVTERASVDSAGGQANDASQVPAISADGRYVAFESLASNLVANDTNNANDVFVRDHGKGTTERVSVDGSGGQADGHSVSPALSATGRFVAFQSGATNLVTGDTNNQPDVFVHRR